MSEPSLLDTLEISKPPYRVPSMAEVNATPWNGLTAVSTFSGCGGSSLGLRMAGWRVPYAVEFTPQGAATYRANAPTTHVDSRDVRDIKAKDILKRLGLKPLELDLFEGSPPCSAFSVHSTTAHGDIGKTKGKVKLYSEGIKQATDDLFDEWLRLVAGIMPKAVLAENVPEMAKPGAPARYLHQVVTNLEAIGYDVHAEVYYSSRAGAATYRRRLIILGVRKDIGVAPRPKLYGDTYSLRDALATFPGPIPDDEWGEAWSDGTGRRHTGEPLPRYSVADHWEICLDPALRGQVWHNTGVCRLEGDLAKPTSYYSLARCDWDQPLPTVTAAAGSPGSITLMHPDECRRFTPTEIKWLSGFPLDFELTGTPQNRYERLGRAVTPPLYAAIAPFLEAAIKAGS